jgi:viroplasmin and RNaseH domain-containing protein
MFHDKGKFVVTCWNSKGMKSDRYKIFDTVEECQAWIDSVEKQTEHIITEHGEATVFICGDGEYWWSREDNGKQKYTPFYIVINMEHAVAMAKCSLESLADKESIF